MAQYFLPLLLFAGMAILLSAAMIGIGTLLGPRRTSDVKQMPYESGMDPIHTARRRFDVRFHLVAITFLIFDVELLFLYPWAVSSKQEVLWEALAGDVRGAIALRQLVLVEVLVFIGMLTMGYVYAWRRGIFRWR